MAGGPGNLKIGISATVGDFRGPARMAMQQARSEIQSFGGSSFFDQSGMGSPRRQSAKAIAASIAADAGAWTSAMKGLRQEIKDKSGFDPRGNSRDMLSWYGMERMNPARSSANQAALRRSAMLPFGNSASYSLTQADIAAADAEAQQRKMTSRERRMGHMHGLGAAVGMLGGPGAGQVGMGLSYAGSGMGAIGGLVALTGAAVAMKHLADEAKRVNLEARQMGVSVGAYITLERVSKESGLNLGAVSQGMASARQGAFGSPAAVYGQLGVGRGDMSMERLAAAFDKIKDPVARARAEIEMFGQAAPEMAEALKAIREASPQKMKDDAAMNQIGSRTVNETGGFLMAAGQQAAFGLQIVADSLWNFQDPLKSYNNILKEADRDVARGKKDAEDRAMKAAGTRAAIGVLGREGVGLAGAQDMSRGGTGQAFDYIYKMTDRQSREEQMTDILRQIENNTRQGAEVN